MQKPKKVSRFKKVFIFHDDFFHNAERNVCWTRDFEEDYDRKIDFRVYGNFLKISELSWDRIYIFTFFFSQIISHHYSTTYIQRNYIYMHIIILCPLFIDCLIYILKKKLRIFFVKIYFTRILIKNIL